MGACLKSRFDSLLCRFRTVSTFISRRSHAAAMSGYANLNHSDDEVTSHHHHQQQDISLKDIRQPSTLHSAEETDGFSDFHQSMGQPISATAASPSSPQTTFRATIPRGLSTNVLFHVPTSMKRHHPPRNKPHQQVLLKRQHWLRQLEPQTMLVHRLLAYRLYVHNQNPSPVFWVACLARRSCRPSRI